MPSQGTKSKRTRISVDVPIDLRWQLKEIAIGKKMLFKDYLQDVFAREAKKHANQPASTN
jgi:hypothetical protein